MEPRKGDAFFDKMAQQGLALEFDDATLKSGYSGVLPQEVNLDSRFSRNVGLLIPIASAAMDTVTEAKMAITIAKLGGIGVIHRNLTPEEQGEQLRHVKRHLNGLIEKPISFSVNNTIKHILNYRKEHDFSFQSFLILDHEGRLKGILTRNDFDLCEDISLPAQAVMSTKLKTAPAETTLQEASNLMRKYKKKILPLVDEEFRPVGMYALSDVKRFICDNGSPFNMDARGRLRVAAAVGTGDDALKRIECFPKDIDVVVIDTAHGDSGEVLNTLRMLKKTSFGFDVVVGNISEDGSAKRLADAGADGIKIGQGPGSICTTRIVTGVGCPQLTAIHNCARAIRGSGIPICADGGISTSGQITKALGAGADNVMLGGLLAGCEETPGETILRQGQRMKIYRGMGSLAAMRSRGGRERYGQGDVPEGKLVPEGIEGVVPLAGSLKDVLHQLLGGLRAGMGSIGAETIQALQERADFHMVTSIGLQRSHPHDIVITADAPNYHRRQS
jgi:IMP dehydrogenase